MSAPKEWRIAYFSDGGAASTWEQQIAPEFKRIYEAENKPEGMALFSHTVGDMYGLSITPESVPYCSSLFNIVPWSESDNPLKIGLVGWVAGDERLKSLATTHFSGA